MATRNHLSLRIFAWLFPLFFILFQVSPLLAQTETSNDTTPTAEQLKGQIQEFFDEVLDVDVGWDALQIRHISNVGYGIDNAVGLNGELRDTLAFARQVLQSELFVRSLLQYDHFWARTLNRKNYSPKEKEIERKFDEPYNSNLKFDIVFTPAWDTVNMTVDEARTNKLIAYNVQIKTQAHGTIETRIDQEELTTLLNEALEGETYDKIGSEAKPAVNASMFDGVGFLVGNDTVETDDSNIERIEFTLPSKQAYGFDAYDNEILAGNYDKVEINGKVYYIPWKSVAKSGTDSLRARVVRRDDEQAIGDTASFKTGTGIAQPAQVRSGALTYNITTTPLGVEGMESLLATYTITTKDGSTEEVEAGRVNLVVYEKLIQKVILVPVNGIDGGIVPIDIKNALDTIYKQAVVEWDVSLSQGITVPEIYDDNQFQDGGTGVFSNYTEEMKKVIKVFDDSYPVDKNTCYLFLLNKPESGISKLGSMPMKKQYGFIYVDNASGTRLAHTIAHELGHGPFRLYHTFSEKNDYYQAKGQTNNLMDYKDPTATRLYKYQWDYIHDPQAMISWLQGEEESDYETNVAVKGLTVNKIENLEKYGLENKPLSFITPTGQVLTLPQNAYDFRFDREKGYLTGFSLGEIRYLSHHYTESGKFAGYRISLEKEDEPYTDPYSKNIDFTKGIKVFIAAANQNESNCQVILEVGIVSSYGSEWDGLGGKKESFADNIKEAFDANSVELHEQQFSPYNCAQQPFTKLVVGNLKHLVKNEEDKEKLLQILQILDRNYPVIHQEYSRYYNMDDYQKKWGDIEDFTNFAVSSNITLDDWLADFKEYEKEINYLLDKIKETSDEEKLRFYARFLTEGQTLLLEVGDRKKILQAYYNASSLDFFAEATIIKTLFYTPQEQLKGLLDELKQDEFKLLFSFHKEINDGFWITKDLHNFSYHKTIGYLIRKYHQLPEITPDNLAGYFDKSEGKDQADKPIKAYYVLGEKLRDRMPMSYGVGDYYYAQVNNSEIILTHYYCKEAKHHARAGTDKCVDGEYVMNGEIFNPFDLIVLFKEGDVKYLDSETDDFGSLVVPAFVFHYLKREQAEQNAWEVAEASLIVASFVIPAGQIAVGLRVGGALGARIIALSSAELLSNIGLMVANSDEFQKWCIEKYGEEKGVIIISGANLLFSATSILTGASGGVQAMKAKDMLSTAATVQKLDEVISGAGKLEDVIPGFKAEDFVKVRMKLLEHVDEVARIRNLPSNINMLRIAYRYEDLVKIAADYPAYANQCKLLVGNGGDILLQGTKVTLTYNDEVIGTLDGSFKLAKTLGNGTDIADAVFDGFKLVKQGDEVGFMVADVTKKVHGVDFNYFYGSVAEFAEQPAEAHKAFYYYSKKDWGSLEALFKEKKLNKFKPDGSPEIYWPPANGGYNIKVVDINPGTLDRYQKIVKAENIIDGVPEYTGAYASPQKNGKLSYASRALQGQEDSYDLYYEIKVLKKLPFKGEEATVIPWHGHVGNGLQLELKFPKNSDWTWKRLIDEGYVEIKPISSPNGKFEVLPNGRVILKTSISKVESLDEYIKLPFTQKLNNIEQAWLAYYPQIFFERKLFEDIMGHYRYPKSAGWGHTSDIASNFKAIDFYDDFTTVGNNIFANKAVSMKTTTTKSVDAWLGTNAVKSNIENLKSAVGSSLDKGITWNGKTIFYNKVEIHIYMPKKNITPSLKTEWLKKLAAEHPTIKFEIYSLEDFVK